MQRTWTCLALLAAAGGCNAVLNGPGDNGCCESRPTANAQHPAPGAEQRVVSLSGARVATGAKPLTPSSRTVQTVNVSEASLTPPPVLPPVSNDPVAGQAPVPNASDKAVVQSLPEYKTASETTIFTMRHKSQPPASAVEQCGAAETKPSAPVLTDSNVVPVVQESKCASTAEPKVISAAAVASASPTPEARRDAKAVSPAMRAVNSKRIHLNYEVKDLGPSGLGGIELWYTFDGRTWKKYEGALQKQPPYVVEVTDEGLYGFTLLARSGAGLSKQPPQTGDLPQVWVEVDTTKPIVKLIDAEAGFSAKSPHLIVRWTASDKNLAAKPITVSYAEQAEGPWMPVATNLENSGRYVWQMPPSVPKRLFVRVEATDTVGNVGAAQSPQPLVIDLAQPTVAILGVEPVSK